MFLILNHICPNTSGIQTHLKTIWLIPISEAHWKALAMDKALISIWAVSLWKLLCERSNYQTLVILNNYTNPIIICIWEYGSIKIYIKQIIGWRFPLGKRVDGRGEGGGRLWVRLDRLKLLKPVFWHLGNLMGVVMPKKKTLTTNQKNKKTNDLFVLLENLM